MSHDRILILDFGSQVTQLIARRVREAHVYCEVHANDVSAEFIREFNPQGIILSGSHMSAYEESTDQVSPAVFSAGVPVLGICYGMQTMAQQLGGQASKAAPSASSATPKCAPTTTPSCSKASRTSRAPKARACSRSG